MVTMPDRPSAHIQLTDRPEFVSNVNFGNYTQPSSSVLNIVNSNDEMIFTSAPSSSSARYSGIDPNGVDSSHLRSDFWRLPENKMGRFRPTKRSSTFTSDTNDESYSPQPKIRLTEEKMLARLRNFHITSAPNNTDSNWFFMQRPAEMFHEIENRMSDEEDESHRDGEISKDAAQDESDEELTHEERSNAVLMSDILKRMLDEDCKRAAAVLTAPNPCTELVLWKPPGDFINDILPTLNSETSGVSPDQNSSNQNTFNDPMATDGDIAGSALHQRRNARQFSKPIIEVPDMSLAGIGQMGKHDMENNNIGNEDDCTMMEID